MASFNKSEPQEPINPTPGVRGVLSVIGSVFGDSTSGQATDDYFKSFEPSLQFMKKFAGKNILITGATGGIGSQVVRKLIKINNNQQAL